MRTGVWRQTPDVQSPANLLRTACADAKRQLIADHQWQLVQEEDKQNRQLPELSHQILELTKAVHEFIAANPNPNPNQPSVPAAQG